MKRLLILLVALQLTLHATNGLLPIGIGVKSQGMGGAGVALPQDSFTIGVNPAGLALLQNREDAEIHMIQTKAFAPIQINGNHHLSSDHTVVWPNLAWTTCALSGWHIGLAYYYVGGFSTDWTGIFRTNVESPIPSWGQYLVFHLSPSAAWQINRCHAIGLAINIGAASFNVGGLQELTDQSASPRYVTNRGEELSGGIGFRIGWLGQLAPCWTVGVTYQSKTWFQHFDKYRGFLADNGNLDLPSQIGFGLAYQISPCVTLAVDAVRVCWEDTRQYRNDENSDEKFGQKAGPGFGWNGQWILKVGLAYKPWQCLVLRIGYNYGETPFGIDNGPNILNLVTATTVRHHVSAGATWSWRCHELSVAYVHGFRQQLCGRYQTQYTCLSTEQNSVGIAYGYRY